MSSFPLPSDFKAVEEEKVNDSLTELESLTPKQRQAFLNLIKNPAAGKLAAARLAGYSVNSISRASGIFKAIEGKLGKTFRDIAGVDESDLVCTFAAGLRAEKIVAIKVGIFEDRDVFNREGIKTGSITVKIGEEVRVVNLGPDYRLRLDTARAIARMGGYEAPIKMQLEHQHSHELSDDAIAAIKAQTAELEKQRLTRLLETDCEVIDGDDDGGSPA